MANSTEEVYVPKFDFKYKVSIDEFYLKYMNQFECPNDWVYKAGAHANIYLDHFTGTHISMYITPGNDNITVFHFEVTTNEYFS